MTTTYLSTLTTSFATHHPQISELRPDGSLILTFSTQDKDIVAIRVISAADLDDSERLHTLIDDIKKQLAVMAGKMNRKAVVRDNTVHLSRFREKWAVAPLTPDYTKRSDSPDSPPPL
jgi:predicted GH43/DUF377 family glycosyl hydrolase